MNDERKSTKGGRAEGRRRPEADPAEADGRERIAKRLARAGVASRREAEALVADGRVSVNGRVLDTPAVTVGPADRIEIDGQPIPAIERTRLFLFHKPAGVVTTNRDPQGRRTVFDVLPEGLPRLITVGRLDINTEGLLLLTNDGGLARVLELPQTGWLRRYRVRVHGEVDEAALAGLKDGIAVDGVFYGAIEAALDRRQGTNSWLTVGLREGKNREVKNVMAALGLEVTRLIRVSYGPFQLAELPEGQVQELRGRTLRDQLGPRLIAEAGANFDAPVVTPFSSGPQADETPRPPRDRAPQGERAGKSSLREEAGGLIRRRRVDKREQALSQLSTSAPRGDRRGGAKSFGEAPRGDKRGEGRREEAPRRSRTSNVWMAPGARPQPARTEGGEEKVVRVPRKPGDRKAKHDAAAKRARPGRAERAAGEQAADRPRREWKPRPQGEERPKRDFKPRGEGPERPKRDWVAKPPRPGRAERTAAREGGEAPQREYRPRPQKRDGEDGRPPRRPRPEGGERRPYEKREGRPYEKREGKPFEKREGKLRDGAASRSPSPRPSRGEGKGEGQRGAFGKSRPAGAGSRPSSAAGPSPRGRGEGGKPARPGANRPGPRKGPPKGPPRGGKKG